MAKIAWASDLHLDFAEPDEIARFLAEVKDARADMLVLCGALSAEVRGGGSTLRSWLMRLEAEIDFPIRFVLGNHDAYGQSLSEARRTARDMSGHGKIAWLSDGRIEPLSDDAVLVGHDGWYDARAGIPGRILMNDFKYVFELRTPYLISPVELHEEIRKIADEAASYLDSI